MTAAPDTAGAFAGPDPLMHPETREFWESLQAGRLRFQQCADCGRIRFPLAPVCWACLSFRYRWAPVSGAGHVHATVRVERVTSGPAWRDAVPFTTGLVNLDGGLRLPGRIRCACGAARQPGTPVRLCTVPTAGGQAVWAFVHDCPAGADRD
jgi:uncharacterized protein